MCVYFFLSFFFFNSKAPEGRIGNFVFDTIFFSPSRLRLRVMGLIFYTFLFLKAVQLGVNIFFFFLEAPLLRPEGPCLLLITATMIRNGGGQQVVRYTQKEYLAG